MATKIVDTSEWEYLKSCRDKICRIAEILDGKEGKQEHKRSAEEKLQEIKKILKD